MKSIDDIITRAHGMGGSDIHIVRGLPVRVRVDGTIVNMDDEILTAEVCESYARDIAGSKYGQMAEIGELDLSLEFACGARGRVNLFRQQGNVSAAIRILRDTIPKIEDLDLPKVVEKFPTYRSGIVLVTGETGSGKSTTLAAILDKINHTKSKHIITLEDPIEYVYKPDMCVINQREIGADTESYANGLKSILREDPDVILIGEMRDLKTISAALTAAETGHLVFATLHTNSAAGSIDRMVNVFPEGEQKQIRMQVSTCLRAVLSQQLVKRASGCGRAVACEVMIVNGAISNLIREGKTTQIENFMTMNSQEGSITMDNALRHMVNEKKITMETAVEYARDPDGFRMMR